MLLPTLAGSIAAALFLSLGSSSGFNLDIGSQPIAADLSVRASDLSLSCPGSYIRIGGSSGIKVGNLDRVSSATVSVLQQLQSPQRLVAKRNGNSEALPLELPKVSRLAASNALTLTVQDENGTAEQSSNLLSVSQTQSIRVESASGLMGATCQPAGNEQWLVGAETLVGRESILILQNSTNLEAMADLEVFTDSGKLTGSGLAGLVVAANDFTVVPLASLAPKAKTLAIKVTSSGGAITAWVQQKTTRGLSNGGIDLISAQPTAATQLAIPGLFIRGSKVAENLIAANPDYTDLIASLHIFVPGDVEANITAQVISSTPGAFGTVIKQTVAAQHSNRFALEGLTDGDYSVVVDSDQPIQAEVVFSRVAKSKTPDFAYLSPSPAISTRRSIVAPANALTRLSILNPTGEAATVTVRATTNQVFTLDKLSATQIFIEAGSAVSIESDKSVAATLVVDADSAVTALNLIDYRNLASNVSVLVR